MTAYDIRIQPVGDPVPVFREYADVPNGTILGIGILEQGMASGKPSVGLIIQGDGSDPCLVQLGAEAFLTIAAVVKGAMERFGHPWEEKHT